MACNAGTPRFGVFRRALHEQHARCRNLSPLGDGLFSYWRLAVRLEVAVDKRREQRNAARDIDRLLQRWVSLVSVHGCAKV